MSAIAAVIAATNGMSVIVWCAIKKNCGIARQATAARRPARREKIFAIGVEAEEDERHCRAHRRDERHVGHRLVCDQEELRHREERDPAEEARAPAEDLGDRFVEEVDGGDRHQEER